MTGGDLNFIWSVRLLRRLTEAGIERCVLSPGSRSSPLALAAAALPALKTTVVPDERSAAFAALGASKTDLVPTLLICTSGTAVANYLPAVVEAHATCTPLLLLTADRPAHLQETGSPQTIRQPGLFSHFAECLALPLPENSPARWNRLDGLVHQTVQLLQQTRSPVHLNIPFDKPLEPSEELFSRTAADLRHVQPGVWTGAPPFQPGAGLSTGPVYRRPLLVAGPRGDAPDPSFFDPRVAGLPMLAEVTSQLSDHPASVRGFDRFLRAGAGVPVPDVIVRLGQSPVTPSLQRLLEQSGAPVYWVQETPRWDDAALNGVTALGPGDFEHLLAQLAPEAGWTDRWRALEEAAALPEESPVFTDGAVFRRVMRDEALQEWNLHLSNSMPVRDADLYGSRGWTGRVFCNRGVSGIDGVLSTAIGAAAAAGERHLLLIGDVALLHDIGALSLARHLQPDLLVILVNNGGGRIFDMLPIRSLGAVLEPYFLTPRPVDWSHACAAFGLPYRKADTAAALDAALDALVPETGFRLIECVTDGAAAMAERRALWHLPPAP